MKKKAQFFLIATFIVITMFISLTLVYNFTTTPVGDQNIYSITRNLKYEGVNIINNGYNNNQNYTTIAYNLRAFTNMTSLSFKAYDIFIIVIGENRSYFGTYRYKNGVEYIENDKLVIYPNNITLTLNSLNYNFELTKGYNFFVITINEKKDEKYIDSQ